MFFCLPDAVRDEVKRTEELLDEHNPWPSRTIAKLSKLAADTPDGERRFAEFRLLALDVDALLQDARWAVGNALLILRAFPDVVKPLSEVEEKFDRVGVPPRAHLLISELIAGREHVIFQDLLERRPGGKRVGAWMVQILADHTVNTSIGVMDRLAAMVVSAGALKVPRNRMYFRSGKLKIVSEASPGSIDHALIDLAESDDLAFLLEYRDGLAHTRRLNAAAMGTAAVDHYLDQSGAVQTIRSELWSATDLLAIAVTAFEFTRKVLQASTANCARLLAEGLRPADVDSEIG